VRVISKSRLRQFWERPGCEGSSGPLSAWYMHVSNRTVAWNNWADVKAAFSTASLVGNCVVFNIGGNKYRLVTRVLFPSQKVFILRVMTHGEYDHDAWKEECGCHQPAPQQSSPSKTKAKGRQPVRRQGKGR
jgi:mRNA interferase HigB